MFLTQGADEGSHGPAERTLAGGLNLMDRMDEEILKLLRKAPDMPFLQIAKKIGAIKKYEAMEYVAGIKIVDIDKAS